MKHPRSLISSKTNVQKRKVQTQKTKLKEVKLFSENWLNHTLSWTIIPTDTQVYIFSYLPFSLNAEIKKKIIQCRPIPVAKKNIKLLNERDPLSALKKSSNPDNFLYDAVKSLFRRIIKLHYVCKEFYNISLMMPIWCDIVKRCQNFSIQFIRYANTFYLSDAPWCYAMTNLSFGLPYKLSMWSGKKAILRSTKLSDMFWALINSGLSEEINIIKLVEVAPNRANIPNRVWNSNEQSRRFKSVDSKHEIEFLRLKPPNIHDIYSLLPSSLWNISLKVYTNSLVSTHSGYFSKLLKRMELGFDENSKFRSLLEEYHLWDSTFWDIFKGTNSRYHHKFLHWELIRINAIDLPKLIYNQNGLLARKRQLESDMKSIMYNRALIVASHENNKKFS